MKPDEIGAVHRLLKKEYARRQAPIIELIQAQTGDPFCILVATILSARTRDETTAAVCKRLFQVVRAPHDFDALSLPELERLLHPIGFFRTKAQHLKALPAALDQLFAGRIPDTIEELCRLPGVGRKTANLVRSVAFDKPAICVDVHVHRISNRLGLLRTRSPLETEMTLRRILPVKYWKTWNRQLVSFGQTVCTPLNPHCNQCVLTRHCARAGVKTRFPPNP